MARQRLNTLEGCLDERLIALRFPARRELGPGWDSRRKNNLLRSSGRSDNLEEGRLHAYKHELLWHRYCGSAVSATMSTGSRTPSHRGMRACPRRTASGQ